MKKSFLLVAGVLGTAMSIVAGSAPADAAPASGTSDVVPVAWSDAPDFYGLNFSGIDPTRNPLAFPFAMTGSSDQWAYRAPTAPPGCTRVVNGYTFTWSGSAPLTLYFGSSIDNLQSANLTMTSTVQGSMPGDPQPFAVLSGLYETDNTAGTTTQTVASTFAAPVPADQGVNAIFLEAALATSLDAITFTVTDTCAVAAAPSTPTPTPASNADPATAALASTGTTAAPAGLAGLALLALGTLAVFVARRARRSTR